MTATPTDGPHGAAPAMAAGAETILIVDDDPMVLELVVALTTSLGYQALRAENVVDALAIAERQAKIDLLITDIRLREGVVGPDLAKEIRRKRPGCRILFMSGNPDAVLGDAWKGEMFEVLHKPFRLHELAAKISAALGHAT